MRSSNLNAKLKPLFICLALCSLATNATASSQYQQDADLIARQAQALGAQPQTTQDLSGQFTPEGKLNSPDVQKYIDQAETLKKNQDLSQQTNRGYVPGMSADSVQAVIDHTQAIRAQSKNSEAVNEIIRRRDEIQGNTQLNESALKTVENKPEVMRRQSKNIEKMFGSSGVTAADFERKIDSRREEALSTENGITIFASFSLPDYVLEDLLRTASEHKARVVFNGLKKGTTRLPETHAAINQLVVKGKFDSPLITIDPDSFSQYQILQVPTILSREQTRFALMVGSFNVDYFQRELASKPNQDIFPNAGTTYPVEEKSIISELEERARKYDWDGAKKRAIADTWKNQWMVNLPPAQEHKEWFIDPTVKVTQDVKDKQGRVIASAGELINPLSRFPQNLTMIIFDPLKPGQVEWAEKQYRLRLGSGQVMPMFTRIQQDNGWDHLNDLREKFNGKVFKVNEQIISRFQIKNMPALISTEKEKFRVSQFSEAEIRGIGTQYLSEEK
ncbi:TrbC family F-type conjugative pilus assembly protein [Photorhabdus tasmaniensis]